MQSDVFEIYTEHRSESMEAELRRLKARVDFLEPAYQNARQDLAEATRIVVEKSEEADRLREAIKTLLLSADCTWEQNDEGHDWAHACEVARRAMGTIE